METSQRLVLMVARIRALMHQQGLTDADLARRTGISPATLSRVLSMTTEDPRIGTILAIADALGSTVGYLLHSERVYPIPLLEWDEVLDFSRNHAARKTRSVNVDTPRRSGTFAVRTKPSMAPRFRVGSIVIVEPETTFRDAQVVVAALKGREPTLYRVIKDGDTVWLKDITASHTETVNAFGNGVAVLGVVTESRLLNP
ncbi:helix-turn-helix domain-containing protein [Burkholderia sp. TSV86]|uniref:helix-turn-helix domain-containing protein n=1 Tax=Burkholderia sp. TSV86 TaxID=1385594 RepID=UPI00075EB726|nr:helix-turn-helix domain-containing protein [Burkholderia sp. TSV86]KVE33590.1 phage repressor [Burkholderia sp. TSV86]